MQIILWFAVLILLKMNWYSLLYYHLETLPHTVYSSRSRSLFSFLHSWLPEKYKELVRSLWIILYQLYAGFRNTITILPFDLLQQIVMDCFQFCVYILKHRFLLLHKKHWSWLTSIQLRSNKVRRRYTSIAASLYIWAARWTSNPSLLCLSSTHKENLCSVYQYYQNSSKKNALKKIWFSYGRFA